MKMVSFEGIILVVVCKRRQRVVDIPALLGVLAELCVRSPEDREQSRLHAAFSVVWC